MTKLTVDRATIEQALEAMLNFPDDISDEMFESIRALRAALAQQPEPAQEPVSWGVDWGSKGDQSCVSILKKHPNGVVEVVAVEYGPPQRPPLTDEEIDKATAQERDALLDHIYEYGTTVEGVLERIRKLCRAVERKVREKRND